MREKAEANSAGGTRVLPQYSAVRLLEIVGEWAVIARDGQELGYVSVEALAKMQ